MIDINRNYQLEKHIIDSIKSGKYSTLFTNQDIFYVENSKENKSLFNLENNFDTELKNSIAWSVWVLTKEKFLKKISKGVHLFAEKSIFDVDINDLLNKLLGKDNWHICKETLSIHYEITYQTTQWMRIFTTKNLNNGHQYKNIRDILNQLKIDYEVLYTNPNNLKAISYATLYTYAEEEHQKILVNEIINSVGLSIDQIVQANKEYKTSWK